MDKPFDSKGNYHGDDGEMLINVDKESFLSMNVPGNKIFLGEGLSVDGVSRPSAEQADDIEELDQQIRKIKNEKTKNKENDAPVQIRGLASVQSEKGIRDSKGINILKTLKQFEISLRANDKAGVQDSIEDLDEAIEQAVLGRSQVGSRVMSIESSKDTLLKGRVDTKGLISQLEDADAMAVVSDINKNEATLKATLQTSGGLLMPSLMDFLR